MPHYQALGTSPIVFLDGNGSQQAIPLSLLYFDGGVANISAWSGYTTGGNQALLDALLPQLTSQGVLFAGTTVVTTAVVPVPVPVPTPVPDPSPSPTPAPVPDPSPEPAPAPDEPSDSPA